LGSVSPPLRAASPLMFYILNSGWPGAFTRTYRVVFAEAMEKRGLWAIASREQAVDFPYQPFTSKDGFVIEQ